MNTHRKAKPYLADISDHSPLLKNVNQGKLNRAFCLIKILISHRTYRCS